MEVKLRPLREKEDDAVYQMFQEIPAEEDGFENPAHGLSPEEFNDFCRRHVGYSQGIGLKPGYVPDTYYLLIPRDKAPLIYQRRGIGVGIVSTTLAILILIATNQCQKHKSNKRAYLQTFHIEILFRILYTTTTSHQGSPKHHFNF